MTTVGGMLTGKFVVFDGPDDCGESTCTYQGAAGYDPKRVIELARFAIDDRLPEFTVVITVDGRGDVDTVHQRAVTELTRVAG